MTVITLVKPSEYHDSVTLMLVARELTKFPGVIDVGVIIHQGFILTPNPSPFWGEGARSFLSTREKGRG